MLCSVLIVDNDRDRLEDLAAVLTRMGFQVTATYLPERALTAATFKPFDLALVARRLPEMSGLELQQRLRKHLPTVRTILLCDELIADFETEAKMRGAFACLLQPCEPWLLEETLELALDRSQAAESAADFAEGEIADDEDDAKAARLETLGVLPGAWPANARFN